MSRLFDGVDDQVTFSVGASSGLPGGALSVAFLCRLNSVHRGGLLSGLDSGATRRIGSNPFDNGDIFFNVAGFTSVGYAAFEDVFAIIMFTKPTGNATVRAHIYRYDTLAWTHTNLGAVNTNSSLAGGSFIVGLFDSGQFLSANACVWGLWAGTELLDAAIEAAGLEASLASWVDLSPTTLWAFNQASTADPVLDVMGGGADQTAITGTTVSPDEPAGFQYSPPASAVTLTPADLILTAIPVTAIPGAVTVTLTAATLTLTAVAASPVPGAVTVTLTPAQLALAAVALTANPGLVTMTLTPAVLTLAAVALAIGAVVEPGTLVASGQALSTLAAAGSPAATLTASGRP